MTNYNERLDKILLNYAAKYFQLLRTGAPKELELNIRGEAKQAIKQLVADEMLAIIGRDARIGEDALTISEKNHINAWVGNQRTKVSEWLGEEARV